MTSRRVLEIFDAAWSEKYGVEKYGHFTGADGKLAHRLIKTLPDLREGTLLLWVLRYLKQDDDFVISQGHKFGTFVYRINAFRGRPQTKHTREAALDDAAQQFAAGQIE